MEGFCKIFSQSAFIQAIHVLTNHKFIHIFSHISSFIITIYIVKLQIELCLPADDRIAQWGYYMCGHHRSP